MQEIVRANCGILFDYDAFAQWEIPTTIGQGDSSPANRASGSGEPITDNQADAVDDVQPIHDQLKAMPLWWILEIIPTSYTYQNLKDKWVTKWRLVITPVV